MNYNLDSEADRKELAVRIKADIDSYCHESIAESEPRSHLGASVIGHKCERYLWYAFRWMCPHIVPDGRMARLFNRGNLEEARFIQWLNGAGIETPDPLTQIKFKAINGHYGGARDGLVILNPYGIEDQVLVSFKTINDKGFSHLFADGMRKNKPQHWAQECAYGYEFGIQYCLYLCINKNDDALHVEFLKLDLAYGEQLHIKASRIIHSDQPPKRVSDNPAWHECKFCPASAICHMGDAVEMNCRSCCHAKPVEGAQWHCGHFAEIIPKEFIRKGCENWKPL